jgi:TonB-dependent receptor
MRNTGGIRADWKFAPRDVLSVALNYSRYFSNFEQHQLAYSAGTLNAALAGGVRNAATGDFSPTFTQGRAGQGSVNQSLVTRYSTQPNAGGSISYRHTGALWDWDAIFSGNKSKVAYRNTSLGQFDQARANKAGLTVRFDDINTWGPGKITVLRGTTEIDPLTLSDAVFAPGANQTRDAAANARNFNFNLKRKFSFPSFYGSLKSGFSFRSDARDRKLDQYTPTYVGPGGNTAISALPPGTLDDPVFSYYEMTRGHRAPQWISARKSNTLFLTHPEYFTYPIANANADYQAIAAAAEELEEQITAGYLMADVSLFKRLRLAGGVRYEQTMDEGRGQLTDNSRQYRKDANGKLVDGNPTQAGIQPVALTTDPLEISKLTRIPLGNHIKKTYGDFYPSLSATFEARDNLLLRLGYAKTLGRPNYGNILPTLSVAQVLNPAENATGGGLGVINAKNPNLKPWEADNYDVSVEYYTDTGGLFTAGAFRKDITNFFTNTTTLATADFLDDVGLSQDYLNYQINYPGNSNEQVRQTGVELAARQRVTRWLSVFGNLSLNRNQGLREADFRGYVRKRVNAGLTLTRNPITFNANFYYTPKVFRATNGIAPDGRAYDAARYRVDASIDWRLTKRLSLFLWGRNIFNERDKTLTYGALTPDYAKYGVESDYGVIFQAGVKGTW